MRVFSSIAQKLIGFDMESLRFLEEVWAINAKGGSYVFLSTKSAAGTWKDHSIEYNHSWRDKAREVLENSRGKNVYFCPNSFNKARRHISGAIGGRMLWADLDAVVPDLCNPVPSIAIESSSKRYVGLWLLDVHLDAEELTKLNRSLTYRLGADKGGWDYTQVLRLPGTRNFKYSPAPIVNLLWFRRREIPSDSFRVREPGKILERYRNRLPTSVRQKLRSRTPIVGHRSSSLWQLEHELLKAGMTDDEAHAVIKDSAWNKFKGRRNEDEQIRHEIEKVRLNGHYHPKPAIEKKSKFPYIVVKMSDVEAKPVGWLWYPYIPKGKLTLIEGDPSMGKSWLTCAIASHVSMRKRLPNQERPIRGSVLLMSAEDGLEDTVRPRLDTFSADVRRIFSYTKPVTLDPEGLDDLELQIQQINPTIIIIDPLVAYMGGSVDLHKANQVREFTARIAHLAEQYGCAIVGIRHLTKGSRDKAIYRGIGSIDLSAAARSVLHVGQDPEDEESKVIVHIKSNLAASGPSIRYMLRKGTRKPFKWMGTTRLRAVDLLQSEKPSERGGNADQHVDWLREFLKEDKAVAQVKAQAERKGFTHDDLNDARMKLGVQAFKVEGSWRWRLT
jgi:hypothetical protein